MLSANLAMNSFKIEAKASGCCRMEAVALSDSLLRAMGNHRRSSGARRTEQHSHSNLLCSCRPYLHRVQADSKLSVAPLPQCFLKNCTSRSCCRAF